MEKIVVEEWRLYHQMTKRMRVYVRRVLIFLFEYVERDWADFSPFGIN